jgi:hypothetical protein
MPEPNIAQLAWAYVLAASLNRAMDGQIRQFSVVDDVDPLKMRLRFVMEGTIHADDYAPFTRLLYAFARANDCVLDKVRTTGGGVYEAGILIKRRLRKPSNKNPMLGG